MTRIFHDVAQAEYMVYTSGQDLKVCEARAEAEILAIMAPLTGKDAPERKAERDRNLTIALAEHMPYQIALKAHRALEKRLAILKADLELFKTMNQQERWATRQAMVDALNRRSMGAEPLDGAFDEAMDEEFDHELERILHEEYTPESDDTDYPYTEDGRVTRQSAEDHYLPF